MILSQRSSETEILFSDDLFLRTDHTKYPTAVIPAPAYARTGYVGNPSEILRNRCLKNSCRDLKVDSRLRGNDGSPTEIYATPCSLPPLPSSGKGLGRGWLCGLREFDFPSSCKATPILTSPARRGKEQDC